MADAVTINMTGAEELTDALKTFSKRYPDRAGEELRKDARRLRKEIVEKTKDLTKTSGQSKKSLGKIGSYKVSQVQGFGQGQYVELSAKSPHFHLVEEGHELVTKSGNNIGFVQGRHMMREAVKEHEGNIEKSVSLMLDGLLKEAGLT